jgi:hypothetical protein
MESTGEIESVAPDLVMTFEYETPTFRVSAHRFNVHEQFEIAIQRPGHELRRCTSDAAFSGAIAGFEALTSTRALPSEEAAKLKPNRAFHRLRIATQPPLDTFDEVLSPLPNGSLSIMREGVTYELTVNVEAVARLAKSCR